MEVDKNKAKTLFKNILDKKQISRLCNNSRS